MYRVEYNDDASELYLRRSLHHRARPFSFSQCININVRTFPEETSRFHEGKIELIVRIDSTLITSGCREMGNNNDRTETISFLLLFFFFPYEDLQISLSLSPFYLIPFFKTRNEDNFVRRNRPPRKISRISCVTFPFGGNVKLQYSHDPTIPQNRAGYSYPFTARFHSSPLITASPIVAVFVRHLPPPQQPPSAAKVITKESGFHKGHDTNI